MKSGISAATEIGLRILRLRTFGLTSIILFVITCVLASFTASAQVPIPSGDCGRTTLYFSNATNITTTISELSGTTQGSGTWEAWVKKAYWAGYNSDEKLFMNDFDYPAENCFYVSLHGAVGFHFRTGYTGGEYVSSTATFGFAANSWHHLAATWSESGGTVTTSIFIDGVAMGSVTSTSNFDLGSTFHIGGKDGSYKLQGAEMAEVRVWNVARTEQEIFDNMNTVLTGSESGLVGYWPLDEPAGSLTATNLVTDGGAQTVNYIAAATDWKDFPLSLENTQGLIYPNGSHAFGDNPIANTLSETFTIYNVTSSDIDLNGSPAIALTGTDADQFSLDLTSTSSTVTGNDFTTFVVNFTPTTPGGKSAAVTITNVASCSDPFTINLSGTGLSASLSYSGEGFSENTANDGSVAGSITITLIGDTFQDDDMDNLLDIDSEVTIGNIPSNLIPIVTLVSSTEAVLTLTGNATAHQSANNVVDLTFEFTDAAFTNLVAATVTNATGPASSGLGIDFDRPYLTYELEDGFFESGNNNGSVINAMDIFLVGDTFKDDDMDSQLAFGSEFYIPNLPEGLIPIISIENSTSAYLSFDGNALSHNADANVSDLTISFDNSAFQGGDASYIMYATGPASTGVGITFYNTNGILEYSGPGFVESDANNGTLAGSITLTLTGGETFADPDENGLIESSQYYVYDDNSDSFPENLTYVLTLASPTVAVLTIDGQAVSHQDINDYTLSFHFYSSQSLSTSAFTNSLNYEVLNSRSYISDFKLDFHDNGTLSYSGSGFTETEDNDGTLTGSMIIDLTEDTFSDPDEDGFLQVGAQYEISNLPSGLIPVMTLVSSNQLELTLEGRVDIHLPENSVSSLQIEFTDEAFSVTAAPYVFNATGPYSTQIGITFDSNTLFYAGSGFTESAANDGSVEGEIKVILLSDNFQDVDSDGFLDVGTEVSINNIPAGLTPNLAITSNNQAGNNWTPLLADNDKQYRLLAYGNGTYVAMGYYGTNRLTTSTDGETWIPSDVLDAYSWNDLIFANGMFIALPADENAIHTSTDGVNWTAGSLLSENAWHKIAYGNGLFVAVKDNGSYRVATSPDGVNWTERTGSTAVGYFITYGNGLFVSGNYDYNTLATSTDGINWTQQLYSNEGVAYFGSNDITFGNGLFVVVSDYSEDAQGNELTQNMVWTSPDAVNWTLRDTPEGYWYSVTYGDGSFAAVGYSGSPNSLMTSNDGITWTANANLPNENWNAIEYINGQFFAVAEDYDVQIMTSFPSAEATLTLTGNADDHQALHNVSDITFNFTDAAFVNSIAANVPNATGPASSGLGITFDDNTPANDDCSNAETITVYAPGTGSATEGSTEFSVPNPEFAPCTDDLIIKNVWYTFNTGDAEQIIFTIEAGTATAVSGAIYTSCGEIYLVPNPFGGEPSPACAFDLTEPIFLDLPSNTDFLIQIWSVEGEEGTFSILLESNSPPDITPINDKTVDEETELTFTVSATDDYAPNGYIEYFVDFGSVDLGMSINASTGEFSWIPTESQDGTYTVTVYAVDYYSEITRSESYSEATFNITVNEVNTAPELGTLVAQNVAPEGSLSYQVTATDVDLPEQTLTFNLDHSSLNKGIYIDESGYISWSPQSSDYGSTNNVEVTVSDGDLSDAATLVITVDKGEQTIYFDSPGNFTFGETTAISLNANGGDSNNPVVFTSSNELVATISGSSANIVGAGEVTFFANQAGNTQYNAAPQVSQTITIYKGDQYLYFDSPSSYTYGEITSFELYADGGDSSSPIIFTSSDENVVSISGSTATVKGAGDVTIYANQAGDNNYNPAQQQSAPMTIYKADQYISFDYLDSKVYGDAPFELSGTGGGSSNPVIFTSSNEDVATIFGTTLTIVGAGDATIYANQAGDDNYNQASEESQSLYVDRAEQIISFEAISDKTFGDGTFELVATGGGSTSPIIFSTYDENVLAINGSTVTIVGAGYATIYATQTGDNNYYEAYEVSQSFEVYKATQEIDFGPIEIKTQGDPDFGLPEFSSAGLPIIYSVDEGFVASVNGNIITVQGAGSVTITAYQLGDDDYLEATPVEQTLTVEALWIWNGTTWNNGSAPTSTDNVRLDADFTFDSETSFSTNNLTLSEGYNLTVLSDNTLDVQADLDNQGSLIVMSGASIITYATGTVSGNDIQIQRNTRYSDGKYSFVGTPVMQNANVTAGNLGANVYTYDEAQSEVTEDLARWLPAGVSDELIPGRGYSQANQQLIEFVGTPNTGTITYSGSHTNDGWHMVSNPYASAIFIDQFLDANTNTTGAVYIWDDNDSQTGRGSNDDYIVANKTGAIDINAIDGLGPNSESRWNGHIGSAQGFFMQLDGPAGDIVFNESMRVSGNNSDDNFFRKAQTPLLRLNLTSADGLIKQTIIGWNESVSDTQLVNGYDAPAFNANAEYAIYTQKAGENLTIQTITEEKQEVQIGFNVAEAGNYTLFFGKENLTAEYELYDRLNDRKFDISSGGYSFTTQAGQFKDRFVLVKNSRILNLDDQKVIIYAFNKTLHVKTTGSQPAQYQIYNLSGVNVAKVFVNGTTRIDLSHLSNGVYIVSNGIETKKIILQ